MNYRTPLIMTRAFVVFPNNPSTIQASRSKTLAAIQAGRRDFDSLVIVVSQKNATIDEPQVKDIYDVGTLCRITSATPLKDYTRLRVQPVCRVSLHDVELDAEGNYWMATGEELPPIYDNKDEEIALIRNIMKELERLTDVLDSLPKAVINQLSKGVSAPELSDVLSANLPLTPEARQQLLETQHINERLTILLQAIDQEEKIKEIDQAISMRVRESTDRSQKEYILREKLKAIKEELGEDQGENSQEAILKRLEENPYPDYIKEKVKGELKRLEVMPPAAAEASVISTYIDWLMNLPWWQNTVDDEDLRHVQTVLDEDHYGLTQVKKRIVEYLAVKKMTHSLKAPILCFYGPPGVGKTSLGKSIARALGRKFHKIALGGISDEAEIRGHRRTYVGAMPGRIVAGMKKVGVRNPVFLLDEVDKLASSYKGDPSSALLEVLDPEQNIAFNDNYIEEPYDLSDVLFIATANYIENVPAPLRDRLELIELNSYTILEKYQIAKEHLIAKQVKANGLKMSQISFPKDAIMELIESYTREAGVRELERKIASICRKVVVELLSNPDCKKVKVTVDKVHEYLGAEIFEDTKKEKNDQIGLVTGLAYTQYGGCVLPIEVTSFPGKGGLVLTGKLGDVMKESATIALDYVRTNAKKYGISDDVFESHTIHVHVPEGAVPKDGPSAGVAITTSIISCLASKPVKATVAMTGEVTLRGNVLPIGGLREKTLAALRSGIRTVIVPEENRRNVEELPEEVKKSLKIVYMKTVDDALPIAFGEKQ